MTISTTEPRWLALRSATASRTARLLGSSACGFLFALFLLTASNLFNPIPWQHDDYNNVVAAMPQGVVVRPVSTYGLHLLAMMGPAAVFGTLIALVITLAALACRFVARWLAIELAPATEAAFVFCAGLAIGLSEWMPYVVRYTGNFTHLLSAALAFGAVLFGMSYIEGRTWAKWPLLVLYTLAVFAKEDVPPFASTALFLYGAFELLRVRDRSTARRASLAVVSVITISLCAIGYNILQQGSFINTTLSGKAGYGLLTSTRDVLDNTWRYLSFGKLLPTAVALHVLGVVALAFRLSRRDWIRFCCFVLLILTLILPYAILAKTHVFEYYTIIWLPLLVAATALGMHTVMSSLRLPRWSQAVLAVLVLVLVHHQTKPQRDNVSLWITGHQLQNRRILRALDRFTPQLATAGKVYVRGIDGAYSPFFFTDGTYANQRVKNRNLIWVVLVRPGSFMEQAYRSSGMSREQPHVIVQDDVASGNASPRPLIHFDERYRATMVP